MRASSFLWAGSPTAKEDCEISSTDNSIAIKIGKEFALTIRAPCAEECGEINTIDDIVARN